MARDAGLRSLSLRETRVARLVAQGLSDEQVAEHLGIGVMDVSTEMAEVLRKLGLRSRTELAFFAAERDDKGERGRQGS
ncbi:MAG: helix-turn-helix transcriptional regulator [Chloroflexi bacterium]|nr:helix-turn-helix transcriptional regulator [Chloroflexota bacterium]